MHAKDTPNFIANRIGTFAMMRTLGEAVAKGYTVEEVDMVFGPATGRPKSAVFRTADVVGLDTLLHVTNNCYEAMPDDERRDVFAPSPVLQQLIAKKWLGAKTKQGFYKKVGDDILQIDLKTLEYGPQKKPRFDSVGATRGVDDVDEKIWRMVAGPTDDRAAELARVVLYETLIYSANRLGEISDSVADIDHALRWGFGWERGPFETWDALGVKATAEKMEAAGYAVPGWVREQIAAQGEGMRFYRPAQNGKPGQLGKRGGFTEIPTDPRALSLDAIRAAGGEVERNGSSSILDLGDGVFCLEFHSKMNTIGGEILSMVHKAIRRTEEEGVALVIANEGSMLAGRQPDAAGDGDRRRGFDEIAVTVKDFQKAMMAIKYPEDPGRGGPAQPGLGGGRRNLPARRCDHRACRNLHGTGRARSRPAPGRRRHQGDGASSDKAGRGIRHRCVTVHLQELYEYRWAKGQHVGRRAGSMGFMRQGDCHHDGYGQRLSMTPS